MRSEQFYRAVLWFYPRAFREEYGEEMLHVFVAQMGDARQPGSGIYRAAIWMRAAMDVAIVAPREHWHVILQDIRYALRMMAAAPAFAAVAILSLALGIGANTAIFSMWNTMMNAPLPVADPQHLVILTDPDASGVAIGSSGGERSLMTYGEFEALRDHASGFNGLMAVQSALDRWQVRVGGANPEEARGRLASGSYFQVLGVHAALGRTFTAADDNGDAPYAVISNNYWRRRFNSNPGVIGTKLTIQKADVTIIGVTPPGFTGETVGESPDLWVPLRMQAGVLPGRDWLHEAGQEKVMWLHVFGRLPVPQPGLQPGITMSQAEAQANSVFKAALEVHYGAMTPERRKEFMDQHLKIRPASSGASSARGQLTNPLKFLLTSVAVVLLIACANLANLLLARSAAREREIALRLSLGASRGRLIRQLLTESLVLAGVGGLAGLGAAYALHAGLVYLVKAAEPMFEVGFTLNPLVLLFTFAVTVAAALLFGMLPAWLAARGDAADALKQQGRTSTAAVKQMRWGRLVVVAQLALCLPLLVGAGLLLRTLYNLQQVDLGYPKDRLLVARIDAQSGGYELPRREPLFRQLAEEFKRIPGLTAVSYSENGLMSGRDSADEIQVEGYTRKGKNDRGARWDQVGPNYFSAVGMPIILGREINDRDTAGSPYVCVINEAFAKLFFEGRNPIGKRITTTFGDTRKVHEVVGVVRNARTHRLRGDVPPRYFVPMTQRLGEMDGAIFAIRTTVDNGTAISAIRQAVRRVDPGLPIVSAESVAERLALRTAPDRTMALLAAVFGVVAMFLAAIGLYGVLSYGITRRRGEIGVRIALGAQPGRVVRMILRETSGLLIAGVVIGGGLAVAGSRLIKNQLYGLATQDPVTLAAALVILLGVALAAAYIPARRVSHLDPMAALRQE